MTENGTRKLIHGLVKPTLFYVSFVDLWSQKGSFHGQTIWVMTERALSQVQAAEMGFLRRVHGVTLRDKVRSCEIRKSLNVQPLTRIERSQLRWFGHLSRKP